MVTSSIQPIAQQSSILSGPIAFSLLLSSMAVGISSVVSKVTSVARSVCAASMSSVLSGSGLFKSSLKFSY